MRKKTENYEAIVKMHYPCATFKQYDDWRKVARMVRPPMPGWFCTDCTPEYQKDMKAEGKCARPEIRFRMTATDGVEGFVPSGRVRRGELS